MPEDASSLDALRKEIDEIDRALHDLLMRRAGLAAAVARAKAGGPAWRPAREARVLYRLVERHAGPFPKPALVRIWREVIAATTRLQQDFAVAVWAPAGDRRLCGTARDHFGAEARLERHASAGDVVAAVRDGDAAVGVLPAPEEGEESPWWPRLAEMPEDRPSVCAALPFAPAEDRDAAAFCIAPAAPEESGRDRTLIQLRVEPGVSRRRVGSAISKRGMALAAMFGAVDDGGDGLFLADIEGFAAPGDERLAALAAPGAGAAAVAHLGCYPAPLTAAALGGGRKPR